MPIGGFMAANLSKMVAIRLGLGTPRQIVKAQAPSLYWLRTQYMDY